jgi:hypothetical protein
MPSQENTMQTIEYTYEGQAVTLIDSAGSYAIVSIPCGDGSRVVKPVPYADLKPTESDVPPPHFFDEIEHAEYQAFTHEQTVELAAYLAPAPAARPVAHMDVVKALNAKIDSLTAELEAERAKNAKPDTAAFYAMRNALDMHSRLLMAAQGDNAAQVQIIGLIVNALEQYAQGLIGGAL